MKGNRPSGTWHERDKQAWEREAAELREQGYTQTPDSFRGAVFEATDGERVALVRHLGKLDWHPVVISPTEW